MAHDPVARLERWMREHDLLTEESIARLEAEVQDEVRVAVETAIDASAGAGILTEDVYASERVAGPPDRHPRWPACTLGRPRSSSSAGGPCGYMAAIRAGQLGKKVLLIEKRDLGGECLNRGCIPSKALIHASLLYHALRTEGPEVGVRADGVTFDLAATMKWKSDVVAKERQGVATLLKAAGASVLFGEARFTGPHSADFTAPDGGHERVDFESRHHRDRCRSRD